MVELPAESCPRCRTNLRTGYTPPKESGFFGRGKLIFGGLVLLLVIIAAAAVLFFNEEEPYQPPVPNPAAAPTSSSRTDFNDAVDTVQSIAESGARFTPGPTQAKPILDLTRDVTDSVQNKQGLADDVVNNDGNQ